jgi:hypothetical protein
MILSIDLFLSLFLSLRGPAGYGRVPGGGEGTGGSTTGGGERVLHTARSAWKRQGALFLYNQWNPRSKDAPEAKVWRSTVPWSERRWG